jgi:hypothetical protein
MLTRLQRFTLEKKPRREKATARIHAGLSKTATALNRDSKPKKRDQNATQTSALAFLTRKKGFLTEPRATPPGLLALHDGSRLNRAKGVRKKYPGLRKKYPRVGTFSVIAQGVDKIL